MERIPTESETIVSMPEQLPFEGELLVQEAKWKQLLADPDIQKGLGAALRTLVNAGIATADLIPLVGEKISWAADGWKIIAPFLGLAHLDPSRAVSRTEAIATEGVEFVTFGIAPSHLYELIMQLKREDLELLKKAILASQRILTEEQADYQAHRAEIDSAISAFKEKSV